MYHSIDRRKTVELSNYIHKLKEYYVHRGLNLSNLLRPHEEGSQGSSTMVGTFH